jgi:hypothetical protein
VLSRLRKKNLHQWLPGYARDRVRRRLTPRYRGLRHLLVAVCDHYEPLWGKADEATGRARVDAWATGYPALAAGFRDADGRGPRHSFFFPGEEYRPYFLDRLAELTRGGHGELEFHLHHDGDTAATLAPQIEGHLRTFAAHGHLSRGPGGGFRWAFIHGNWALANSRPDRRWCGVDDELPLLHRLGCYADFTFPSAPDPCQPDWVNAIYWPRGSASGALDDLTQAKSFARGQAAEVGVRLHDRLLMITGPLALTRKGRAGVRLENGALTGDDPPTPARVASWVEQDIHVGGRPDWVFVKVHTHGSLESTTASLLGGGGRAMHETLATRFNDGVRYRLHYVTAREMYNVAVAAMDGKAGDPSAFFDYDVLPPPAAAR